MEGRKEGRRENEHSVTHIKSVFVRHQSVKALSKPLAIASGSAPRHSPSRTSRRRKRTNGNSWRVAQSVTRLSTHRWVIWAWRSLCSDQWMSSGREKRGTIASLRSKETTFSSTVRKSRLSSLKVLIRFFKGLHFLMGWITACPSLPEGTGRVKKTCAVR